MRDGPREVTLNCAWTPRRTNELHLRPAGSLCCAEGASIDFVNGLLKAIGPIAGAVLRAEKLATPPMAVLATVSNCRARGLGRRPCIRGQETGLPLM